MTLTSKAVLRLSFDPSELAERTLSSGMPKLSFGRDPGRDLERRKTEWVCENRFAIDALRRRQLVSS